MRNIFLAAGVALLTSAGVARADTNADHNYPQTNALQGPVETDCWM
jgi:hypothetical protein